MDLDAGQTDHSGLLTLNHGDIALAFDAPNSGNGGGGSGNGGGFGNSYHAVLSSDDSNNGDMMLNIYLNDIIADWWNEQTKLSETHTLTLDFYPLRSGALDASGKNCFFEFSTTDFDA